MRDAEAIAEAVTRPTMRFVPIKDVDQQDIQALHRVRERLIGARTALINEVHGLMLEYGIVIPKGVAKFRQAVVEKLEADKDKLTALSQELFWKLVKEFAALEDQIAFYQEKLETLATMHPECQRLMTIPGIGPISATALVAAVGDVGVFKNGRQFAAWLGLVPKQHSTGGQSLLLTNGVSCLQTNKPNSTCRPYCHGHALPPSWSKAYNPARSGGVYDHHHRVYHGLILSD
jgi:transposase